MELPTKKNKTSGFTLIELSIVLVIISLIVGAIVAGKRLLKSTELKSLIQQINTIRAAWSTFQLQYDGLPGDFAEAEDYWPPANYSWIVNGDGNYQVSWASVSHEPLNAFEHMIIADLLAGPSGNITNNVNDLDTFFGFPPLKNSSWSIIYSTNRGENLLRLHNPQIEAVLSAPDMKLLDTLFDDGLPSTGRMIAYASHVSGVPDCTDGYSTWNLDETDLACFFSIELE